VTQPGDELALRAGDRDRERAAEELRRHHLEGRLDADELEERLGRAYGGRTLGDLAGVLNDLPVLGRRGAVPPEGAPAPRPKVGGFGLLPFSQAHDLPVTAEEAYLEALDSIVGAMVLFGYHLVERHHGQALVFAQQERPAWVYLVCVAAFPFGLLALSVKRSTHVRIEFLPRPADRCRLRIAGEARRPVRKAFAALSG
jgi:hypothetical protein